jgi:hypothetical protein
MGGKEGSGSGARAGAFKAQAPDQPRGHEEDHRGHEEALALAEGGCESSHRKKGCSQKGRGKEGGGESSACEGVKKVAKKAASTPALAQAAG